jgi:hypothetical protein
MVAFVDADTCTPQTFLQHGSVQIIGASSLAGTDESWVKQGDNISFATTLVAAPWWPNELLTGFVIPLRV